MTKSEKNLKSKVSFLAKLLCQTHFFHRAKVYWRYAKSIRFSLKSRSSERFHTSEMSQIKAEISLRTNVKLNFHKNVGLKWYQWIPDFYNIRFEQTNLTEKNMWAQILCYKKSGIHWYHCNPTFLWQRLISALIRDISGLCNRSDGRDFREKRIGVSRFLMLYID